MKGELKMQNKCTVIITSMPDCDICKKEKAIIDGRIKYSPWAYMCWKCFEKHGVGLGLGKGQELFEEIQNENQI